MRTYIIRRLLLIIPTLLLMVTLLFFLLRVMPGDVAFTMLSSEESSADPVQLERLREELGLNDPIFVQYGKWLGEIVRGNLGYSHFYDRPVTQALVSRIQVTATLAIFAVFLSMAWSIPLGVLSAVYRGSWIDQGIRVVTAAGLSMPNFWLGIIVLLMLVRFFDWIPPVQHVSLFEDPFTALKRFFIPAMIIGFRSASVISRMTRSMMLEVLSEDYVRTARSKGLAPYAVMVKHALPNALLPVVTMAGLLFAALLDGAVVIEAIFQLPGMGMRLVEASQARDFITVQGLVLSIGVFVMVWILVIDIMYAWLDPRIKYE